MSKVCPILIIKYKCTSAPVTWNDKRKDLRGYNDNLFRISNTMNGFLGWDVRRSGTSDKKNYETYDESDDESDDREIERYIFSSQA